MSDRGRSAAGKGRVAGGGVIPGTEDAGRQGFSRLQGGADGAGRAGGGAPGRGG